MLSPSTATVATPVALDVAVLAPTPPVIALVAEKLAPKEISAPPERALISATAYAAFTLSPVRPVFLSPSILPSTITYHFSFKTLRIFSTVNIMKDCARLIKYT